MARILITGGLGFVGSHLLRKLLERGDEIRVLDVLTPAQQPRTTKILQGCEFELHVGDVRNSADVDRAMNGIDWVFHLASHVGLLHYLGDPVDVADVIYIGTREVARAAQKRGVPLVFLSTSELYGRNPETPWQEEDDCVIGPPSKPRWVYSIAKNLCEHLLFGMGRNGLYFTTLRLFNLYGPGQDSTFFITRTLWRLCHQLPPVIFDGGSQIRCFTYIDDAINGILMAATSPEGQNQVFNIGSNAPTTILEAVHTLSRSCGIDATRLTYIHQDSREIYGSLHEEPLTRIPDIVKAERLLGWKPQISLAQGSQQMLHWVEERGWWVENDEIFH
jgi:dTDP-alpha-D-glucuronic acid decarboxylase